MSMLAWLYTSISKDVIFEKGNEEEEEEEEE